MRVVAYLGPTTKVPRGGIRGVGDESGRIEAPLFFRSTGGVLGASGSQGSPGPRGPDHSFPVGDSDDPRKSHSPHRGPCLAGPVQSPTLIPRRSGRNLKSSSCFPTPAEREENPLDLL